MNQTAESKRYRPAIPKVHYSDKN